MCLSTPYLTIWLTTCATEVVQDTADHTAATSKTVPEAVTEQPVETAQEGGQIDGRKLGLFDRLLSEMTEEEKEIIKTFQKEKPEKAFAMIKGFNSPVTAGALSAISEWNKATVEYTLKLMVLAGITGELNPADEKQMYLWMRDVADLKNSEIELVSAIVYLIQQESSKED